MAVWAFIVMNKLNASVVNYKIINFGMFGKQALSLTEINVVYNSPDTGKCRKNNCSADNAAEGVNLRNESHIDTSSHKLTQAVYYRERYQENNYQLTT